MRRLIGGGVLAAAMLLGLAGCGGKGGTAFDSFEPRPASASDFEGRTFSFSWLPNGNPVSPSLGEMDLSFTDLDVNGEGSFKVAEHDGGEAKGTVRWTAPYAVLTFAEKEGDIGVPVPSTVTVLLEAEKSDGRIRLTSQTTGNEAASDLAK